MVAQHVKKLFGYSLMFATVPAAIFLAPQIGAWTIALVLVSGSLGGWLTLGRAGQMHYVSPEDRDEDPEPELSIYEDPKYSTIPGNFYNVRGSHDSVD